jgi:hypothetical protein
MSVIIVAPVVVNPLVDSNNASIVVIPDNMYGIMPKTIATNHTKPIMNMPLTGLMRSGILNNKVRKKDSKKPTVIGQTKGARGSLFVMA